MFNNLDVDYLFMPEYFVSVDSDADISYRITIFFPELKKYPVDAVVISYIVNILFYLLFMVYYNKNHSK